ncbi:hypothetical protein [Amycolatopsis sp. NPDC021455]|uniref:hypothetical protein n=1 Tax=Amycolatopsis sp. NPDC021455 TaxID=3154901 RepID=UPI00340F4B11
MKVRRWISGVLAAVSAVVLVLTLSWPDWIEEIFGVAPDSGDGSAESLLVVGLAAVTVASSADAGLLWWRLRHSGPRRFGNGGSGHGQ